MAQFNRNDEFPSWIENALLKALSLMADQFVIVQTDDTHIEVPAGADDLAALVTIKGLWRWVEATVGPIAHPGGAAGTYPVFVTAAANSITNVPNPNTDNTNYSFGLTIRAQGATPAIVPGSVDVYRHVADLVWDGARITAVDQFVPSRAAGAAGGDLAGTLPSPTVQHVLGGQTPLAVDSAGRSVALQLLSAQKLFLQAGVATFNTNGSGWQSFTVNFPVAFPAALISCVYSLEALVVAGLGNVQSELRGPAVGGFGIDIYSIAAITVKVHWHAVGS